MVSDDENDQAATGDAFEVLHFVAAKRLAAGKLTVVDATNVQPESRKPLVELARRFHCLPVAIVLDLPVKVCAARNRARTDRGFGPHVVRQQAQQLRRSRRVLEREGFRHVFRLTSPEAIEAPHVICEEKHMGSRAIVIVCEDDGVARRRFGVVENESGICYTRTGRRFFDDLGLEAELIARIRSAGDRAGLWERLTTDWLCLDCEIMPWSAKAQELLRSQYAAVGAASRAALADSVSALEEAARSGLEVGSLLTRTRTRAALADKYVAAYRRYCWPVTSVDHLRVAPFHLLASEGAVHAARSNSWHLETLSALTHPDDPLLMATSHTSVDVTDAESETRGIRWWEDLTARGGEGMVVKPLDFVTRGRRGLVQPAVKCRGPEYLRIIYGLEYSLPENIERLRSRGLSVKRSLALREFALGVEGLERFVRREPLRRVHECVFGVLALESEPVDPRL